MNTNWLIEKITNNWFAKVVCFGLALFIYIFRQVSLLDKKTFTVPLSVISSGAVMPSSEYPNYVKVTVRAKTEDIASIFPNEVKAFLNLDSYTEDGIYTVPVSVKLSSVLLLMDPVEVIVKPENIELRIEEKSVSYIPVEAVFSGEPEHGYAVKATEISPSTVKVIGPKSMLNRTKQIYTQKVNIKGAKTDFSVGTELDNINTLLTVIAESDFKVTVEIEPEIMEADFKDIVPKVTGLDPRFVISGEVPAVSFRLSGTVPVLDKFSVSDSSVQLDCSSVNAPGIYDLPVLFFVPGSVTVKEKSADMLKVTFVAKTVDAESPAGNSVVTGSENNEAVPVAGGVQSDQHAEAAE